MPEIVGTFLRTELRDVKERMARLRLGMVRATTLRRNVLNLSVKGISMGLRSGEYFLVGNAVSRPLFR